MPRRPIRYALLALAAGIAAAAMAGLRPGPAEAASPRLTPGQLTILNKKGQSAGLCPLTHTDVSADIAGYVSRVTVKQEFANPSHESIEAVYTFPLPADAAVDDMRMTIGNRVVLGQIKRKEEAREIYEAAKSQGKAAALLDQERPNIFTQSVANIMPGDKITVTISYVNLLKYDDGAYEFSFPMVVGPRYIGNASGANSPGQLVEETAGTAAAANPGTQSAVTDPGKITPPITPPWTRAGHDISLSVRLDAGLPLQQVRSTLHAVNVERMGAGRAIITLKNQADIPNKDFILRYSAAGSEMQEGVLTYATPARTASIGQPTSATSGYFTLILQPPLATPQSQVSRKEMVFVIDQTGSQSGWPIQKAKETMVHCIKNLNPGDTFQLLGFNTDVYPCFEKPVPANFDTIARALKFLAPIEGRGGTDILKSVDYALKIPDDPDRLRIVCYMTDGYVGNDMQILDYIQKHRGRARMFPFGVGNSVNRFLVDGMAREGKGAAEYVTLQDSGEAAAARFYKRISSPLLLNPTVDWGGLPVEDVYPKQAPDVFSAGPVILKGRYTRAAEGDVTIHGLVRGRPWNRTIHVKLPALDGDGSAISTLWAREKLDDLQNQDWLGAQTGKVNPAIKEQIVNTALEYRLMSEYTSFVAVEERAINVGGNQRTIEVPVEMPEGVSYDGFFGRSEDKKATLLGLSAAGAYRGQAQTNYSLGTNAPLGRAGAAMAGKPAAALPAQRQLRESESLGDTNGIVLFDTLRDGKEDAIKLLAAMKPEERVKILRESKLSPDLHRKVVALEKAKKSGLAAIKDVVEVQIRLNKTDAKGLEKLKELGFNVTATLLPDKLLLGMVDVSRLDELIGLAFVRKIETPKIR
jgi:Ca-activated chloride channel family protein